MGRMTHGIVLFAVLILVPVGAFGQSTSQWVGTWKLNLAKSKYDSGPPPTSGTATFDTVNGVLRLTVETVNAKGERSRTVELITFDGKEQPVTGAANPTTRISKYIDNQTFELVTRVSGKETGTTRLVLSRDGKTTTLTNTANKNVTLWEK
jgi:hypothetical protein